jgi:hypothetical protein
VLESIEGLASEEKNVARSQNDRHVHRFIFPAIVTNAELAVCRFEASKVKISDGTLDEADVKISTVPFIRFRKSLTTDFPEGKLNDLRQANMARQKTVFVVNAAALSQFLKDWEMSPIVEYATQRLLRERRMSGQITN